MTNQDRQYNSTGNMRAQNSPVVDPQRLPLAAMAISKQGGIVGTGLFNG